MACVTPGTASAYKFLLKSLVTLVTLAFLSVRLINNYRTPKEVLMEVVIWEFYFQLELNKLSESSYGHVCASVWKLGRNSLNIWFKILLKNSCWHTWDTYIISGQVFNDKCRSERKHRNWLVLLTFSNFSLIWIFYCMHILFVACCLEAVRSAKV